MQHFVETRLIQVFYMRASWYRTLVCFLLLFSPHLPFSPPPCLLPSIPSFLPFFFLFKQQDFLLKENLAQELNI